MRPMFISIIALCLAMAAQAQTPAFTNVTSTTLADATGHSRGVAWGDYDGDGDLDIYVTNWTGGPNRLHQNNGDGTFTWINGTILDDSSFGGIATWVDMDNDGDLDLFVTNSGANRMYRNEGGGSFSEILIAAIQDGGLTRSAAWADVDLNGFVDLYFSVAGIAGPAPTGKVNKLFLTLGPTVFFPYAPDTLELPLQIGRGVAWADYDLDGDMDLYVANGGPPASYNEGDIDHSNALFRNNGDGTFSNITPPELEHDNDSRSATWVDYDNDGDFDLFVTTVSTSNNMLFRNTGDGFVATNHPELGAGGRTRDASWGDHNNDGYIDVYLSRVDDNRLLQNVNGGFAFINVTSGQLGNAANGRGVAWADFDDDGDLDLFNATTSANTLFRNDTETTNHWLKVRLEGVSSNRSAVGARIKVTTGDMTQMRQVTAGEGYMSCPPLEQHFGLGQAEIVDRIEIIWPSSSIVQIFEDVPADQVLIVVEAAQGTADINGDGLVNGADLATLLSLWGSSSPEGDLTNDGVVNGADLAVLLANWGGA